MIFSTGSVTPRAGRTGLAPRTRRVGKGPRLAGRAVRVTARRNRAGCACNTRCRLGVGTSPCRASLAIGSAIVGRGVAEFAGSAVGCGRGSECVQSSSGRACYARTNVVVPILSQPSALQETRRRTIVGGFPKCARDTRRFDTDETLARAPAPRRTHFAGHFL